MKAKQTAGKGHVMLVLMSLFLGGLSSAFTEGAALPKSVNAAAALRSLQNAVSYLGSGDWQQAAFEARLGATYDPAMADFPFVEAVSLIALGSPRADSLERLETSLGSGLFWRTYTRDSALLLCSRLYAETGRYGEALTNLSMLEQTSSADADYTRVLSLYGLSRVAEARNLVSEALDRWPFDSRFARVFLEREADNAASKSAVTIAQLILSRLYLWEEDDRQLLLLSVPFQSDPAVRERNIRIYRGMGKSDYRPSVGTQNLLSTVYALEYGLLTEAEAIEEVFAAQKTGIDLSALTSLCRLAGAAQLRKNISERLASFDGLITDDSNHDGINDSFVHYRLGRPSLAVFDPDQDGYPDFTVACDLGAPQSIRGRKDRRLITYDTYPSVRSAMDGEREYTLRPLALSWKPVIWKRADLGMSDLEFFTMNLSGKPAFPLERELVSYSSYFTEADGERPDGRIRVSLERGIPVSAEARENGKAYSRTAYERGYPSRTTSDRDGDGYFETNATFGPAGILETVTVDRNGNRRIEYREDYASNGTVTKRWDSDENGQFEISNTLTASGDERTEWLRGDTGVPVIIIVENGKPRSVSYAELRYQILKDPVADVWWIGGIPADSRSLVAKINDTFNHSADPVVFVTVTAGQKKAHAVRTGGIIFAELVDE